MTSDIDRLLNLASEQLPDTLARLKDFIAFESISTDPSHKADMQACCEWLVREFEALGMEASVRQTTGHPIVIAHDRTAAADAPHILYYGHYDVQPPAPLEEWRTPPFTMVIEDGPHGKRIVARGTSDDKGNMMTWVEALRIWKAEHGSLPARVSIIVEGEEEILSPSLLGFLKENREELSADACMISDTLSLAPDHPALTISMRGLLHAEITVTGPSCDLHSGSYGGVVVNPIHVLSRMIAGLHDADGRVTIPGFYDDVEEPPAEVLKFFDELNFDLDGFLGSVGLRGEHGEANRSAEERMWTRPCCDINGIWGGFIGEGRKTVIPSTAHAKLSCRLVPGQTADKVIAGIREYFAAATPADVEVKIDYFGGTPAVRVPHDDRYVMAARRALKRVFARDAGLKGGGGTLPLISDFKAELGLDCILMGFGMPDDLVHAPNEKFDLVCLEAGIHSHLVFLDELVSLR
ncbi:MAG: M20 family dipeptidase [Hyphomicrobiales bacterium]|nr:MAG: M20 family dipeptidase [Hyphomicrobiales bacterium]